MFKMYGVKNRGVYSQNRLIDNNEFCYVSMTTIRMHSHVEPRPSIPLLPVRLSTISILKYVAAAERTVISPIKLQATLTSTQDVAQRHTQRSVRNIFGGRANNSNCMGDRECHKDVLKKTEPRPLRPNIATVKTRLSPGRIYKHAIHLPSHATTRQIYLKKVCSKFYLR
jgi:hypothetical protein